MRARSRRGNVLITALFMAIFLFFLSVAMISTNRMDISLGLSVDHRLKADSAARAGLSWALQTMRTKPDWAALFKGGTPVLESGASFKVEVRGRSDPSGSPYLLVVISTGTSGLVTSRHWAVVEEVKKTPEGAKGSAQLFTRAWNDKDPSAPDDLAMLGSDFQWYNLGPLPAPDTTLEASGGPLFVFAPEGTAQEPPSIVDSLPMFDAEKGTEIPGPLVRLELVPPGRHLLKLEITKGVGEWKDLPDPGVQLGHSAGLPEIDTAFLKSLPVIRMWEDPKDMPDDRPPWDSRNVHLTGRGDNASGFEIFAINSDLGIWNEETRQYENITTAKPPIDALGNIKTPTELTLKWEKLINTPLVYLEWYSLTGTALSARGDKIACQGIHTFYGHYPIAGDLKWPDYGTPVYDTIVYQRPCILEFDLETEKWTPIVDLMSVPNKMSDPIITRSPPWKEDFLELDSKNRAYITATRRNTTKLIRFDDDKRFEELGQVPGETPRVVVYNDRPYYVHEGDPWPGSPTPRKSLMGFDGKALDPNKDLGGIVPAVSGFLSEGGKETETQFKPREEITLGLASVGMTDITTWGKDLVALGYLKRDIEDLDFPQKGDYNGKGKFAMTPSTSILTFFRYDGLGWQVFPTGGNDMLKAFGTSSDPTHLKVPSLTARQIDLCATNLALASYVDGYPDLRRYAVLVSGKDDPPQLKGFTAE